MSSCTLNVVMPVYNEASSVRIVIEEILNLQIDAVEINLIIVGGGSSDGTDQIIQEYTFRENVKVVIQDAPRGKGNAVREGFNFLKEGIVLIQDGDREYRVDDYPALINPIIEGTADFVLGSRYSAGPMREFGTVGLRSSLMNLGHLVFTFLFNFIYRTKLKDPFTMYKVFRTQCLDGLTFKSNRFDFDYELLAKLVRSNYFPIEVPIHYRSRGFSEGKKIKFFRDPLTWIFALIRFRFEKLKAEL